MEARYSTTGLGVIMTVAAMSTAKKKKHIAPEKER
jgi:hypothetical protein